MNSVKFDVRREPTAAETGRAAVAIRNYCATRTRTAADIRMCCPGLPVRFRMAKRVAELLGTMVAAGELQMVIVPYVRGHGQDSFGQTVAGYRLPAGIGTPPPPPLDGRD